MVQSVSRVLDILEALAFSNDEVSLSRLQAELGLPPPTLHRLLRTLVARGYVEQNSTSRQYGPGFKLLLVAEAAKHNSRFNLSRTARPFLRRLTAESGETSNLVVPQNNEVVYVDQIPSPQRVRMFTEVGQRAPLYCTGAGKAILSRRSADQIETYVTTVQLEQLTPHTFASTEALRGEVASVAERGFAIDNEEFEQGVRCVAAPIADATGSCIGAISVSGPTSRLTRDRAKTLGELVLEACRNCSAQLGYNDARA